MALKRKIRNLPNMDVQMSFFDPVYQNDDIQISDNENENDLLADGIPRPAFEKENNDELNETLDTDTITNNDQDQSSEMISISTIMNRIKQIQNSIQQAKTMFESMEKFKSLVPGSDEQREKLRSIIANLEEQQAGYVNLLNLITLTTEERSEIMNKNSAMHHQTQMNTCDDDDDDEDDLSLRRNIQSIVRPRIESKIGFIPQTTISTTPTIPLIINSSDNEQTNRHDNSNYDSLVGSLKSDTFNWKDQQSTSDDEASNTENEKDIERNLMLQKEQFRALQGQKRALLALKRRSKKHLIEQQELTSRENDNSKETNNLLFDINNLRKRLKHLRNLYQQKYHTEIQQLKNSINQPEIFIENRLKNFEHVRERLDELEQIVTYYQIDLNNQQNEETSIELDDTQYLKTFIQPIINNDNNPKQLDQLSNELATKRLELEQAKSTLSQLQQMVKTIQPDEHFSSVNSTPISKKSSSQEIQIHIPNILPCEKIPKSLPTINNSVDVKMAAQHREIERLVESRQRLHTIKDQITSLHQSMTTPPIQLKTYEDKLNDSKNIRPLYNFNHQNNNNQIKKSKSHIKQSNFCISENLSPKYEQNSNELNIQMNDICRCLSTFIQEQKSFNRHIEQRLTNVLNPSVLQTINPIFNQFQQQIFTQGLIVNLNAAYREIAVLQSEINALQSENNRLTSSISFDNQYHQQQQHIPHIYSRDNSKESLFSYDQIKSNSRPKPRSKFDEQLKQKNHILPTNNLFENSSKTSFNSESTGKQTAIHVQKKNMETTPIKYERNVSDTYNLPNHHHRHSSKENLSKSFIIHRRPISTSNENNHSYNSEQKLNQQSSSLSINDYQQLQQHISDDSDNEQQSHDFTTTQESDNIDTQTLDLQVKSIMVQLIPFMRLHINEIFNQSILNHIRERILFLFKQQPDSAQLIRHFQNQFSELLDKTIEKYCGTTIRECAADLIRDISDATFDELVKYKIYENTMNLQTKNNIEQNTQLVIQQQDEYTDLCNSSNQYHTKEISSIEDGDNDNKYQIELAESENRPLTLICSDKEDNDSDQEENNNTELETAVSRQESNLQQNESSISTELNSNGNEYVLVNRSISNDIVSENEVINDS